MKKILLISLIFLNVSFAVKAQTKFYASGGPEIIFSMAEIEDQNISSSNIMRFAPFFNMQVNANLDFGKHFGLFLGGAIRNVGFIYEYTDTTSGSYNAVKKKFRTYNFGIPVGVKLGIMNSWLFYGGYEFEFPFTYKEKTFINNSKQDTKVSDWFSSRVPSYYGAAFVGVQFPYGFSLKFKYYFSEFFSQGYVAPDGSQPYQGLKANVWYFSLNFGIFRNPKAMYGEMQKNENKKSYY